MPGVFILVLALRPGAVAAWVGPFPDKLPEKRLRREGFEKLENSDAWYHSGEHLMAWVRIDHPKAGQTAIPPDQWRSHSPV